MWNSLGAPWPLLTDSKTHGNHAGITRITVSPRPIRRRDPYSLALAGHSLRAGVLPAARGLYSKVLAGL
jgi:hypothetical protein